MTTLIVDFDLIFHRSIRYGPEEVESALDNHAYIYQKLSTATLSAHAGGSALKRIWFWSNDTEGMRSEFPDGLPTDIDIRLEVAKLRTFMEEARGSDYYTSKLHSDAATVIRDWENAHFNMILVGSEPADRMRFALKAAGLNSEFLCRRLTSSYDVQDVLSEFDLGQDATAVVARVRSPILVSAKRCSLSSVSVIGIDPVAATRQGANCVHVAGLSDVMSVLRSPTRAS